MSILKRILIVIILILIILIGGFMTLCGGIYFTLGLWSGISEWDIDSLSLGIGIGFPFLAIGILLLKGVIGSIKPPSKQEKDEEEKFLTEEDLYKK